MSKSSTDWQMKLFQEFIAWQAAGGSEGAETAKRKAFFSIWTEVRQLASQNRASFGMEHLDTLVKAVVLREDTSALTLGGNVLLLQAPSDMRVGAAPDNDDLAPPVIAVTRGKRSRDAQASGSTSQSATTRSPPKKRCTITPGSKSKATRTGLASAKRSTVPSSKSKASWTSTVSAPSLTMPTTGYPGPSPTNAIPSKNSPAQILADWDELHRKAAMKGKTPARVAYPWKGRRLWYNPEEFPAIYRAHCQFWMKHRQTFWDWSMHFPLDSVSANGTRRKAKMRAIRDRFTFLSLCIETWGWYGFMERWDETDHDSVMWLGGRVGKHAGKNLEGKAVESLAHILREHSERYDMMIKRALDPETIDADGYAGVQEVLEQTGALDPDAKTPTNRLSDRALERIRLDVWNGTPKRLRWKGDWGKSPWRELMGSSRLDRVQDSIDRELKPEPTELPV